MQMLYLVHANGTWSVQAAKNDAALRNLNPGLTAAYYLGRAESWCPDNLLLPLAAEPDRTVLDALENMIPF